MSIQQVLDKKWTFGQVITAARKEKGLRLKDCAALILKEDGSPISLQYLNDIENGRRNPPSNSIVEQLAKVLAIPVEVLYFYAGRFPTERITQNRLNVDQIVEAYQACAEKLNQNIAA